MPSALLTAEFIEENSILAAAALAFGLILFTSFLTVARCYKRCPSNRVLVIYGRTSRGRAARTLHGGGAFVVPLFQSYEYLNLDPIQIEIPLDGALSMENIRISVPSVFTVAIGTEETIMNNAAVRLLGLKTADVMKQAEDIIFGQMRQVIASMGIQDINRDRDQFLSNVQSSLEPELAKIGLVLINVNIKDIRDEAGYIEAIGRKAAAEAINQAQVDVAEQERRGAIGVADAEKDKVVQVALREKELRIGTTEATRDQSIKVAELEKEQNVATKQASLEQEARVKDAERAMRVSVADANARAVEGENLAKARIAAANSSLQVQEAEAYQRSETRKREAEAAVREAQFLAEARAAEAEARKREMEKRAELESVALAQKAQTIVDAEAAAARRKLEADAEAAAIFARLDAEARGQYEILSKKAQALREIVDACGGANQAFQMLMVEHIEKLSENAAKAISNIKFDKVVVWDGGQGENGRGSTANFLHGLSGALPPVMHMMRDIGGVELPPYFGKLADPLAQSAASGEAGAAAPTGTPPVPSASSNPPRGPAGGR
jgi:flotillin